MGYNVGMPTMKLDRNFHPENIGKKNVKIGNARSVLLEALSERNCKDEDYDADLTADNIYWGCQSGEELAKRWTEDADAYVKTDKNGKQKHLQKNAIIGFAGICKPEMELMNNLSDDEIKKFMVDSAGIIQDIYKSRGMDIDSFVVHMDEGNPHMHYFGHDDEYRLGRKMNLGLYKALNHEYPKRMQELGWDINDLDRESEYRDFEKSLEGKTEDEQVELRRQRRKERKSRGVSSEEYKKQKKIEELDDTIRNKTDALRKTSNQVLQNQKQIADMDERERRILSREREMDIREMKIKSREDDLDARRTQLNVQISDLNAKQVEFTVEKEKWLKTANMTLQGKIQELNERFESDVNAIQIPVEDSDTSRKAYLETLKLKNGMSGEDAYQESIRRKQQQQQQRVDTVQNRRRDADRLMDNIDFGSGDRDYEF